MASRMREDPLIKIHSESSKEHYIEASTCLTMIFERVSKAVPPPLWLDLHSHTAYNHQEYIQPSPWHLYLRTTSK